MAGACILPRPLQEIVGLKHIPGPMLLAVRTLFLEVSQESIGFILGDFRLHILLGNLAPW